MNILKLLITIVTVLLFVSCLPDDEPSNGEGVPQGEVSIADLKTDEWRQNIDSTYTVEGYLMSSGDGLVIMVDPSEAFIDRAYTETNYIHIQLSDKLKDELLESENYVGTLQKITGTCKQLSDPTVRNTAEILGDMSQASLELSSIQDFSFVNDLVLFPRPKLFNICEEIQGACDFNPTGTPEKFALLYSGGFNARNAHIRYWNDLLMMHHILKSNGYRDENIRVVYKDGTGEDAWAPVHYAASQDGLEDAFQYLQNRMTTNSKFFLMLNNHGAGFDRDANQNLGGIADANGDEDIDDPNDAMDNIDEDFVYYNQNVKLNDDVLGAYVNSLPMSSMIAVVKPCYSGGIINDIRGENRVILTSGTEWQVTWANQTRTYGEFTQHFMAAVYGIDAATGLSANADINSDGRVSMYEAHMYILANDDRPESPQYEDDSDGIPNASPDPNGYGANVFL